jgi:hypothetical protein
VDVRLQVREGRRRRVEDAVEDLDQTALLGDEHTPVGREADDGRVREPAEDGCLREAGKRRGVQLQAPEAERPLE